MGCVGLRTLCGGVPVRAVFTSPDPAEGLVQVIAEIARKVTSRRSRRAG
jgi:hypothetical protein